MPQPSGHYLQVAETKSNACPSLHEIGTITETSGLHYDVSLFNMNFSIHSLHKNLSDLY